jgi:hypothetical protein
MANEWDQFKRADVPAAGGNEWDQFKPQEFAREINTVVDDPARAAPMRVQAGASLRTRVPEQIKVYSDALGIPADRFGTLDGQIVYRDDKGDLVRVSPSLTGATGVGDAVQRFGSVAARNAGEALPAAASALAVGMGPTPLSIPAAGALAGVGEYARQGLGDALLGSRPEGFDNKNAAAQTGMAMVGQGLGVGATRLLERNPAGVTGYADRQFFRDPANVAETQRLAGLGQRENVTLFNGDVTGRNSLLQRDRQLGRMPDTTDDMGAVVARRNATEVPAALDRNITAATGAQPSVEAGRAAFHQGARQVIDGAFEQMQGLNSPLFRAAFDATPGPISSPALTEVMRRPAVQQAMQEARLAAANAGRPLAEGQSDLAALHLAKRSLDGIVNGGAHPVTGALRLPGGREVREARDALRGAIIDATGGADSLYGRALAESAPRLQAFAELEASGIGRQAAKTGTGASNDGLAAMFNGGKMAPERIATYRQAFEEQGQGEAWRAGFSAYLRDAMEAAQKTTQRSEPSNVAGKFYQQVFGDPKKQEAVAAALGGRNTPEFQMFAETMDLMRAASRSFAEGSPTATDVGGRAGFASGGASAAANGVRALNPLNWPNALGNFIEEFSAGRNARAMASGYAEAGPAGNGAFLNQQRLLPGPAVAGLGEGGQLAAYGLGGLLSAPADNVPPARRGLLGQQPQR